MEFINSPAWSPDSKYLIYKQTIENGDAILATSIWSLNVETKENTMISEPDSINPYLDKMVVNDDYNLLTIQKNKKKSFN